ncbi:MAG TPA: zinc ribbon domain-containing protein [Syntrophales bacterium]|jgi:putative FmdB family regulatory protein|nr:zinc ribbon domain-containing protein [Syntrophus sp. (in: bacteria)]HOD28838.1 zinc ribbon domain-containing protein [Syntrophales bacterium]
MPIYEYKCKKCGKEFEVFQHMSDPAVKSCRFCKGPVNKLMSLSSFHLKGSGWYVTDYGGKKVPHTEKKEASESAAPAETPKTEAAPKGGSEE